MDLINLYYQKYKSHFVPATIIVVSVFILYFIFYSQVILILSKNKELDEKNAEIASLNKSLTIIKTTNDEILTKNVNTFFSALPDSKDILSIYLSALNATTKTKTNLKSFTLKVGTLYSRKKVEQVGVLSPSLSAQIEITGNSQNNLRDYATVLLESLPLTEVKKMNLTSNTATYEVVFYYKPLDTSALSKEIKVEPINERSDILKKLDEWNKK